MPCPSAQKKHKRPPIMGPHPGPQERARACASQKGRRPLPPKEEEIDARNRQGADSPVVMAPTRPLRGAPGSEQVKAKVGTLPASAEARRVARARKGGHQTVKATGKTHLPINRVTPKTDDVAHQHPTRVPTQEARAPPRERNGSRLRVRGSVVPKTRAARAIQATGAHVRAPGAPCAVSGRRTATEEGVGVEDGVGRSREAPARASRGEQEGPPTRPAAGKATVATAYRATLSQRIQRPNHQKPATNRPQRTQTNADPGKPTPYMSDNWLRKERQRDHKITVSYLVLSLCPSSSLVPLTVRMPLVMSVKTTPTPRMRGRVGIRLRPAREEA